MNHRASEPGAVPGAGSGAPARVHTETYWVSSFDIGPDNRLSVTGLCRYLQEAAGYAATGLGVGYNSLESRNLVWILSRFAVRIRSYLEWEEEFTIETWPSGVEKLFAYREFRVLHQGSEVATGTSAWLAVDIERRRPRPMKELLDSSLFKDQERLLPDHLGKIPIPDSHGLAFTPYRRQVVYSDLDRNDHVNNIKYLEWILDSQPCDLFSRLEVEEFQLNFVSETRCSELVQVETAWERIDQDLPATENTGTRSAISVVRRLETGVVSASARVVFRPRSG